MSRNELVNGGCSLFLPLRLPCSAFQACLPSSLTHLFDSLWRGTTVLLSVVKALNSHDFPDPWSRNLVIDLSTGLRYWVDIDSLILGCANWLTFPSHGCDLLAAPGLGRHPSSATFGAS